MSVRRWQPDAPVPLPPTTDQLQKQIDRMDAEIRTLSQRLEKIGQARRSVGARWPGTYSDNYTAEALEDPLKLYKVREFSNWDVFDTLNEPALAMMIQPPPSYNTDYQASVNKTLITAILSLNSRLNSVAS